MQTFEKRMIIKGIALLDHQKRDLIVRGLHLLIEEEQTIAARYGNRADIQLAKGRIEVYRVGLGFYDNADPDYVDPGEAFRQYCRDLIREEPGRSIISVGRRAACREVLSD